MCISVNKMPVMSERLYRFFGKKVAFTATHNACWNWTGFKNEHGYGLLDIMYDTKRIKIRAHRLSYYIHNKIDPMEFVVRHTCDNPACCNPNHLILGTQQDNVDDMKLRGRMAVGEKSSKSKRTEKEVLMIRALFENGMSRKDIAKKMDVPYMSVISIILRREWKHI